MAAIRVSAYGKILTFPEGTSEDQIKEVLARDEVDLNPDYKAPAPEALDYAKGFASGANKLVSGVGYLAETAGANETGKAIREFGDRGAAYWNAQMSPGGKKAAESQVFVDDPESITGLRLGDDAGKALLMGAAQSLPSMFAAALPGVAITKGIQALASLGLAGGAGATIPLLAGTAAPVGVASQVIARAPAAVGFGAAEGVTAGAMNAAGLKTSIEGMSDKDLLKSPVYQALRAQHGEEKARTMLADQAASDLFGKTAVSTGAIGALTGGGALGSAYQKVTSGAADGILMTGLKGAGQEAIQETPQSGAEKYIENITSKEYLDPSIDPMSGVIAEAASGGAIGAFTGGIVGAGSAINITKQKITPIAEAPTLDDAIVAAHEAVSPLRTEGPTLADVEALNPTNKETANETQKTTDIAGQPQAAEVLDIVLPDNSSVKAQWKIVDADSIKASMKEGVSQPRDRTRASSDAQVKGIAKNPDYRRLSDSPVMDIGAPIIDMGGNIVAGNGRFEGVSNSYDQGTSQKYLDALRQDAVNKGIDPAIIDGMKKPVLIRSLIEPVDTRRIAISSNAGLSLQYSTLEQSKLDAERMKGIENLDVNDLGDIALTPRNLTQLKDSFGTYTENELAAIQDKGGQLSQEGVRRVRNAMLAKAYGSSPTLEKLVESTDSDMRNVLGALTKSANHIIKTKGDVKPLMEAVDTYSQLKATGQPVDNFLAQQDAFSDGLSKEAEGILRFIDTNVRSQKKLTDFFRGNFVETDTTSVDMFTQEAPKDASITSLEKHLKDNGYDFTVEPASVRDVDALDSTKKARKELAEKQAKLFKKKVIFVKADGPFRIDGVMVPSIADTIFVDIRTAYPFDAIMAHELSHWMEQENPAVYKELVKSLKTVIINEAEYAKKYGIEGATKSDITKEIVGNLMGDNFTEQSFWNKVAAANPGAFKDIAAAIIKWLKGIIVKAKANGMGSEQWVKDATKAQDIIAKAVAQYTESEVTSVSKEGGVKFHKAFHGSPHDHNKFDSSKIGTGEGAQAYGYGHYFTDTKEVAEYYKEYLSSNLGNYLPGYYINGEEVSSTPALRAVASYLSDGTGKQRPIGTAKDIAKRMNPELSKDIDSLPNNISVRNKKGKLYEVELAPEQDEYLLWDEPLSEQSDKVKAALGEIDFPITFRDSYKAIRDAGSDPFNPKTINIGNGNQFYADLSKKLGGSKATSEYLHSLGIRGIKYLDGFGRGKGEGTYNYVVFDAKDISITAKFSRAPKSLNAVEKSWDSKGITHSLSERNGIVTLNKIVVPKDSRNAGVGADAMRELTDYADATNQQIALTPSADFGGNKSKLQSFYKRFGFRKNNEFNVMESMIRDPELSTVTVDGVERPTTNSEGKPITNPVNFWKWFGDSKVVDEQGRPKVVYHGTNKAFSKVNVKKGAQNLFWFSSDKESILAGKSGASSVNKIMSLYVRIENPANWKQYDSLGISEFSRDKLDGAILPRKSGQFDGFVLDGSQVKSIDNNGDFSTTDMRLKFSRAPKQAGFDFGKINLDYGNIEQRPGTTDKQKGVGISAYQTLLERVADRAGARVLGLAMTKDFREQSGSSLIGKEVITPDDLATVAQVLRDPRFETFRVFYVKDGKIVHHTGLTSRLPGAVNVVSKAKGESQEDAIDRFLSTIRQQKIDSGAHGYYLLHNHPSGQAVPSTDDELITKAIADQVPGFISHLVIDSNEYATISRNGQSKLVQRDLTGGYGTEAMIPHDALQGRVINGPASMAEVGKLLQRPGPFFTLLGLSAQNKVISISEVPLSVLAKSDTRLVGMMRRFARNGGASRFGVVAHADELMRFKDAVEVGVLLDAVDTDGNSLRENPRVASPSGSLFSNSDKPAIRVAQFSRAPAKLDAEYMDAVNSGDMERVQQMVDSAAREKGYISGADYRMMHQAPNRDDYSMATIKESDIVPDDYWTHPQYYQNDATERTSFYTVKAAIESKSQRMWVYRSVPKDVKDDHMRNGDWVSPSREYAKLEGEGIPGGYRIIAQRASLKELWWDVNSINELGFDDGKEYAYKNTKNNRKLLDSITYDDDGEVIPLSKRFDSRKSEVKFSRAPKLYSKLEQALESTSDKVFSTGPQVKLWLQSNAGKLGIKKDEIYWSGIDNWLDAQGKVSKQQVVEFVRNNGVKVEDVTLGDISKQINKDSPYYKLNKVVKLIEQSRDPVVELENNYDAYQELSNKFPDLVMEDNWSEDVVKSLIGEKNTDAKHNNDKLTLPGGTDYKELVVTVPTIEPHNAGDSTHFGDTGQGKQIGWLRMDTRDGGLFIEELQSQRAQQGRSKGFLGKLNLTDLEHELYNLQKKSARNGWSEEDDARATELYNIGVEDSLRDKINNYKTAIPPAPFVSDANNKATNAYITLLMKKALIEAVSNDHASVSWTTGDQQADRYDLSKQIGRVTYTDDKTLRAYDVNDDRIQVINQQLNDDKELVEYIGKDAAEKLLAQPARKDGKRELSGLALKTGGEWAQSMYGNEQGLNLQSKPSLMSQAASDIFKNVGSGNVESINGQPGFYVTPEMKSKDLPLFSRAPAKPAPPDESRLRRFQRMNQDSFNRFTVIKEWLAENGQTLSDKADVYGAEERYHSKAANQLEDFREQQRNPLIEKIQKAGYTLGDIEVFLKMQHAQEANAQIRKLGDNPDATAYGIEDQEAADYLTEAPENLAKLANEFRAITEQTKKLRLDAGILNTDITDAWEGAYKHYVPVKGEADSTRGVGKGLKTNFKSKRRLGHSLRDEHVIENILMDHERAILEVERNRVGKHLVMMAAEMQRPDILSIDQPEKRKMLKESTAYTVEANGVVQGVFKSREEAKMFKQFYSASMPKVAPSAIVINQTKDQRVIASASPMLAENEVNVYMNGHAIRVQINDELLARAYTKMGVEQFSDIVGAGRILNGYLSKVYTGYNPEFILTNMTRDFSSGTINLTGEQGFGMATKALTNYPRMFTDLLKYAATNGKSSTKWIDAYRKNGGNTGAAYLSDMERLGNEVNTGYASYQGVLSNLKQGDNANAARAAGRKVFNATLKWIYNLNQAGENAMRLAAFKAMIDSGRTVNEAAKVAKNITVNFNRKGERQWTPALYLFYNASVQGTAATGHALFKGKHKGQAWALAGSMAAVGYMMAASFGGGDENDWDEINDYTKERNMIIKSGDGYVKVPVPYGYGFFWNFGRHMADAQRTGELGKIPWHLATSAISELTPFNEIVVGSDEEFRSDQVFMGLLPTAMKIVAQPTFNKQLFTGSELMPESQFDKSQPDRQKMFRITKGTMYDTVAGWLDSAGIDVSPETLKYITRTGTGGAGSLVDTGISAAMLKAEGAELDTQEIPFVRKAYMELGIKDKRAAYYKVREEARTAAEEFNRARRDNDVAKMQDVLKDKKELIALDRYANKLAATIDAARDQQDAVRADKNLSVQEKRLKLKDMEAQEAKFYDQYLDVFKAQKR